MPQALGPWRDRLKDAEDSYLFHEYFEDVNEPCYVSEFLRHASDRGLRFLAEARLGEAGRTVFPQETQAALEEWAGGDRIARGNTLISLARGRSAGPPPVHYRGGPPNAPSPSVVETMSLSAQSRPVSDTPDCDGQTPDTFRSIPTRTP